MRPGPSDLRGSVGVGARVEVVRGREVLATDVPVQDVVVDATQDRVVPTQLTYTAPRDWVPEHELSPLSNFGQRSHVSMVLDVDGTPATVEIGWFLHTAWEEQDDGVQVTAVDLMQTLVDNPLDQPSSPPSGASLLGELRRMCAGESGTGLPVVLDDPVDRSVPRTTQYGTNRAENVRDLCESYGLEYAVKPDGYLHVWARRDGRKPVAHYSAKDLGTPGTAGVLLDAPRKSQDRRPNRWTVVGTQGSGDDEQVFVAKASATQPPYDIAGYGIVRARYEMNQATSQAQVTAAAQTYMRNAMITSETRSLEIPADPRLELGDIISAQTDTGEMLTGRVTAYSLPVSEPDARMRVDVGVLKW
jgi:hypothetical protein